MTEVQIRDKKPQFVALLNNVRMGNLQLTDILVYAVIRSYWNDKAKTCYPSVSAITEDTGLSKSSVLRAIKRLGMAGHFTISKTRIGKANFRVNNYGFPENTGPFEPVDPKFLQKTDISPEAKSFVLLMLMYMYKDEPEVGRVSYSYGEIANLTGLSYHTVRKYCDELEGKGYLYVTKSRQIDIDTGLKQTLLTFNLKAMNQDIYYRITHLELKSEEHDEAIADLYERLAMVEKELHAKKAENIRLSKKVAQAEHVPYNPMINYSN